jgi:hypothetical protein
MAQSLLSGRCRFRREALPGQLPELKGVLRQYGLDIGSGPGFVATRSRTRRGAKLAWWTSRS